MREIVFDTETTGFEPGDGHRIVEIGLVELVDHFPTGNTLQFYLNPERDVPIESQRVHGLSGEFLADKPLFSHVVEEFLAFIGDAPLVIHNAAFDIGFLDKELERCGKPGIASQVAQITDSLLMAREMYPGKSNSLDALCKRLEVDNSNRTLHGALLDAGLLAEVYICMTRGQGSLVIDEGGAGEAGGVVESIDLRAFDLPLLRPTEEEMVAHRAVLADIDKASRGKLLWQTDLA